MKSFILVAMNVLQEFLVQQELRQRDFAEQLGYTPQYISNLVNGRDPITPAFVGRVMLHYGAEAGLLFLPSVGSRLTAENTQVDA
jgi:plasmid maintenance system antidote protein VapI